VSGNEGECVFIQSNPTPNMVSPHGSDATQGIPGTPAVVMPQGVPSTKAKIIMTKG
jgi:hypothetical protein